MESSSPDRPFNSNSLWEEMENEMNQSQAVTPKIQTVPKFLRDYSNFVEEYEPSKVSLGPIHNSKYQIEEVLMERLRNKFVQASGKELDVLCEQIKKNISQLRNCFDQKVTEGYNDDDLASLLCKDGCAILQFIYQYICYPPTLKKYHDIAQDILKLENQIPYEVLKVLMRLSKDEKQLKTSIATFIGMHVNLPSRANPQRYVQIDGDHVHLLDLLRTSLLGISQAETLNNRRDLQRFRNVRELRAAGIHLRQSSDRFLRNIVFSRRFHLLGRLYLPPITVDNSTRLKFLNLVAYEMCPGFKNDLGPGVISYLSFLNSLIHDAQDVKELRVAGVLYNSYGNDTKLQELFSEICHDLWFDHHAYIGVKEKIQEYHGTLMSKMFEFYHAYIKDSSWPLIIISATLLDLFFGGTQSWFAFKNWF